MSQKTERVVSCRHNEQALLTIGSVCQTGSDIALRSNHLEALKGDWQGQYNIRVNDQWCIYFEWRIDGPYRVEVVDYR